MATSNTSLRVSDLDFFSIRNNLKDYLRSQSTFTDYDFEGSGMAVMLDLLAYNTYYNSFYLNMVANESFLDTAQIRQNVLSHAKLLNYVPTSARGATTKINVLVTPTQTEDPSTNYIVLDRYTRLLGQDIDGVYYPFVTVNANGATRSANTFSFSNVVIKQGEVVTREFQANTTNVQRRYEIPSQNVDTSTITVSVQESSTNTYTTNYYQAGDVTEISNTTPVFFLEENDKLNYTIYFGDDVIGKKPANGNIIIVTYLDTVGSIANSINNFTFIETVGGLYSGNVRVTPVTSAYGGTDKEDIDKIRFRAPQYYTSQNRAVTVNDYESIITKDYNNIEAVSVWGGEDNDPVVYGKVYMSLKTRGYYTLTALEKESIKENLITNRNVLTVIPEIVDPDYVFLQIRGSVLYNPSMTQRTANELIEVIKAAIDLYTQNELNTFKSTFKKAKLQQYIEQCEPSITGSNLDIYLQKRVITSIGQSKKYVISFNTSLLKGSYDNKLFTYPAISVYDSNQIVRDVYIEEVPESFTGVDGIDIVNPGINYETAPLITISGDGTGATATASVVDGKITKIIVTNKGSNYTRATVTITGSGSEGQAIARLEAKYGTLRTFYYKTNGEKVVVNSDIGSINYETGRVELVGLNVINVSPNDFYPANTMTMSAIPSDDVISPLRNRILTIEANNPQSIQINMVPES